MILVRFCIQIGETSCLNTRFGTAQLLLCDPRLLRSLDGDMIVDPNIDYCRWMEDRCATLDSNRLIRSVSLLVSSTLLLCCSNFQAFEQLYTDAVRSSTLKCSHIDHDHFVINMFIPVHYTRSMTRTCTAFSTNSSHKANKLVTTHIFCRSRSPYHL